MGWKQWSAVVVVIGAGILLQIPGHTAMQMDHEGMSHPNPAGDGTAIPEHRTVALDVTGMT